MQQIVGGKIKKFKNCGRFVAVEKSKRNSIKKSPFINSIVKAFKKESLYKVKGQIKIFAQIKDNQALRNRLSDITREYSPNR